MLVLCFATTFAEKVPQSGADSGFNCYVAVNGDDHNDGSRRHPWATIQHASEQVKPGYVVHVQPGTYKGPVSTSISGAPVARIRFVSEVKWGAVIRSTGAPATWTNDADFIDIVGFDVSGDGYLGIFNRGSNVRIIANQVHDVAAGGCTGNGGAGILNGKYSATDNDVIGNVVHNIGERNKSCPRVHGIYHSNSRGRIVNNITYGNEGYGIHLWHAATDVTIANNLVFNNRHGGILVGAGDAPYQGDRSHPADHVLVVNNIVIYNQNRYGIEELGVVGRSNQYVNNLVYQNHDADWKLLAGQQSGTISEDPHFLDYRADGAGDYRLSSISPASGRGTSLGAPSFDIDGRPRVPGSCDIGPYQSATSKSQPWPPEPCFPDCALRP
jgi:parallel beta-helix repeat protein